MMLALGTVLVAAAFVCGYVALNGVPVGRVDTGRITNIAAGERPSALTRMADALVRAVEVTLRRGRLRPFGTRELELARVSMSVASLVATIACLAVAAFAVGLLLSGILLGVVLAAAVPLAAKVWLNLRGARQRRRFAAQLPQGLQMMAASLRAGHSLPRVLDAVAKEVEAPMSEELARAVNENRLGRDLVAALEGVADRMDSQDFVWVVGAIASQRDTGGNLNEILDQVAATIRERQHIRLQVQSLSAEGRLSAVILMALPVCIGLYYVVVSGDTMQLFVDTTIGKALLAGSALMYVVGGLWMRSIVDIEF